VTVDEDPVTYRGQVGALLGRMSKVSRQLGPYFTGLTGDAIRSPLFLDDACGDKR